MSNAKPISQSVSSSQMLLSMVGIGVFCALLIVVSYEGTLERIEQSKAEALEQAIFRVIPGTTDIQAFQLDENQRFIPLSGEVKGSNIVFAGYDENNRLTGIAIEASGQGYADIIRILYGYNVENQTIIGFYVLESKETPGLGDKIQKDFAFLSNFESMDVSLSEDSTSLENPVTTVKQGTKQSPWEVDGITGATISSRAIGTILSESTARWMPLIQSHKHDFTKQ